MKTLKCPLCGKDLELWCNTFLWDCHAQSYVDAYYYSCISGDCAFCTMPVESKEDAKDEAKKCISQFPPIMRVQVGDRIRHLYQFNPYRGTPRIVEEVNVQEGWIRVTGNKSILRPNEITTWPWELEEKGGK